MNASLVTPPSALVPITRAIRKAQRTGKLVVAVVGDSVAQGCCTSAKYGGGFFWGIRAFLQRMPALTEVEVQVKHLGMGGRGPKYLFMCSGLTGEEDIVVYENVFHTRETEWVLRMVETLRARSTAVVLLHWKTRKMLDMMKGDEENSFVDAANKYEVPLIEVPTEQEACHFSTNSTIQRLSDLPEHGLYQEQTHPNAEGHWLLTCLLASVFENAAANNELVADEDVIEASSVASNNGVITRTGYVAKCSSVAFFSLLVILAMARVLASHAGSKSRYVASFFGVVLVGILFVVDSSRSVIATTNELDQVRQVAREAKQAPAVPTAVSAVCYDASSDDAAKHPQIIRSNGFDLHEIRTSQTKRWWQGNKAGDNITFRLPASTEIVLFIYQLTDHMGMADVVIDGNATGMKVNGWFEGLDYLPPNRGIIRVVTVARNLTYEQHDITLIVRNESRSPDGSKSEVSNWIVCVCLALFQTKIE